MKQLIRKHYIPLLRLATPLALTGLMQSGVYFFETMFLSKLGQETLAAGALVSWLSGTLTVILLGILSRECRNREVGESIFYDLCCFSIS